MSKKQDMVNKFASLSTNNFDYKSIYLFELYFALSFTIKAKKNSDLYNSLYTNSYTDGNQYTDIYANLRQPNMGKIYCLKANLNVKNININT